MKIGYKYIKSNPGYLRYAEVEAPLSDSSSPILFFINGRSEWIEKYTNLYHRLVDDYEFGRIYTYDHRGQGGSGGIRGHISSYTSYAKDFQYFIKSSLADEQGAVYECFAHSMGGLITLYAYIKGYIHPKLLVLSSPLLKLPTDPLSDASLARLAKCITGIKFGTIRAPVSNKKNQSFATNQLTSDKDNFEILRKTPYPYVKPSFGWIHATIEAIQWISEPQNLAKIQVPVLVFAGTDETVLEKKSFQNWVTKAKNCTKAKIELVWLEGAKHELFFENQTYVNQILKHIQEFKSKI